MDIKQLIGEATEYDKKEKLETKRPKSWCKSVSAFANGIGGSLVFGVTDDEVFKGMPNAESDAELISEHIKAHLNPIPDFVLRFEQIGGMKFVILDVVAGNQTPYYYEGDGQLIAFVRVGNQSVPASPIKLRELVLKGSGETYDALKSKYDFENMSFTKLKSVYKQRTGNTFEDSDYESFGIVDEKGNLTNAGALLADESPVRHSRAFCTRWNGLDKASGVMDAIDDREYSGGLITLLQSGIEFVTNNSKKAWKKVSDGRIEMPDYPERAVMEGLVNALIHRNYLETGSEVHIDMFDDRLEIYSPGGMVDGSKIQEGNWMDIPSRRRNPIIADIFSRLKYMERRGSGFKKILGDYEKQPQYTKEFEPRFFSNYDSFFLILRNLNYIEGQENEQDIMNDTAQKPPRNYLETTQSTTEKIIGIIKENPSISMKEMATIIGITPDGVKYHIRNLKAHGIITREGADNGGYWKVVEK